ncbi:MAG TPA: phosphate/phosphite/phosphonate ABC transporter substrate-binding protein [Chloroflexota bacterium]|nr:phosphate/phosphite/phosphonate ABC transporter substrate-binding protein [Chloroflexota bacterium]
MWRKIVLLMVVVLVLAACGSEATPTPEAATAVPAGRTLVLGDISDEAAETIRGTQPTADYLAAQLADMGISGGTVKIAPDLDTMIQWINDGEVDIYFDSPYPVLVISDETGATPILRRFRFGVPEYHSVFFVPKDSEIDSLDDLVGKMVAFEEIFSTSGYMLPLSHLVEMSMNPVLKSTPESDVAADEIGYVFSTADDTTVQWVISGKVPAGVVDNVSFSRLPADTQAQLKIIAATEDVPRQMVLVRAGMDVALVSAIRTALLEMEQSEEGRAALEKFQTTEFAEFEEGAEVELARMRQLYELVQAEQ